VFVVLGTAVYAFLGGVAWVLTGAFLEDEGPRKRARRRKFMAVGAVVGLTSALIHVRGLRCSRAPPDRILE
jgi:hypothetical protein